MKTMKTVSRKENMHPIKSHIPRPQSTGKKMKARPAPDFNKLHKKWEEELQNGKIYKKKPSTLVQPFDVTKPGTKFSVQTKTTVLNEVDDYDMDFEGDQRVLDTLLQNRGLSERKVTGRTIMEAMSMSTGKIKNKSCTNGKRRILGELPCDPDQLTKEPITAKKSLAFDKGEKPVTEEDFETDSEALHSILNDTGIQSTPTTTDDRQTFAGSVCRPSLLHHPLPARLSCMSAINKKTESKFDTESLLKSIKDRQHGKSTDVRHPAITKSPIKHGSSAPIVTDSPFGQRVMIQNRHSIYGDYHINPMSSPAVVPQRPSVYRDHHQFASPALKDPPQKPWKKEISVSNVHKHVKWADVLNSYSSTSPCAVPKIKEKKTLFNTIDEIDNDIDEGKENIEPPQQQHEIDKINNRYDVTTAASDGQRKYESSFVATASQNSAESSMTHSKLLEPREKHLNNPSDPKCKVQSIGALRESTPTRSFTARRIPVTTSKNDSDNRNCVSNPASEKNRTVCKDIETSLHHSGIQLLPKEGVTHNGTAFNLLHSHSTFNHGGIQVSGELSDGIKQSRDDNLKFQNQGEVSLGVGIYNTAMAMHTEEKEEKEDSDVVSSDPNSQTVKNRSCRTGSDSESVDKFVGRVKKSRKRQSVVELNESIVESQVHLHKLQVETEKLQDVKDVQEVDGSQTNMNILQQLQLISKQQEQLQILQKQLQEQLSQQTSVSMAATISRSHDTASVSSANESNNNVQQQSQVTNIQNQGHVTGCDNLNINTCTENIINNNLMPITFAEDNQNISQPMSIFVSSTAALSQTLSHSRTWSPCKDMTMTPSKRQPRVAIETEINITPYVQKTIPQMEGKMPQVSHEVSHEQIRSPTPIKQQASSSIASLYSSTPPLWTPLALMEASHDLTVTPKLCDNDIKTCTSQVAAIDLSVKRPIDDEYSELSNFQNITDLATRTGDRSVSPVSLQHQQVFTPMSAFSRVRSPSRLDDNIGPLSLRANIVSSPVDLSSKKKRLSIRRTVISVSSEKYQEALLDEECSLYSCRLQTVVTPGCGGRSFINPVARMLLEGDEMHFIPIREDSPVRHYVREGSAFKCYSP